MNVKEILDKHGLDPKEIAPKIFPKVQFPQRAFARVLSGETELSATQIETLACLANVTPNELFGFASANNYRPEPGSDLILIKGPNFNAILSEQTHEAKIYYVDKGKETLIESLRIEESVSIYSALNMVKLVIQDFLDFN